MIHVTYQSINVLEPQMSWNWKRILLIVGRFDEQPPFPGDPLIQKNTPESEYFGPKNTPESGVFLKITLQGYLSPHHWEEPKIALSVFFKNSLSQGYFWIQKCPWFGGIFWTEKKSLQMYLTMYFGNPERHIFWQPKGKPTHTENKIQSKNIG